MKSGFAVGGLSATFMTWSLANVFTSIGMFGATGVIYQSAFMGILFLAICKRKQIKMSFLESKKVLPHAIARVTGLCLLTVSLLYVKVGIVDTIIACNIFLVVCVLAPMQGEKFQSKILFPMFVSVTGVGLVCLTGNSGSIDFDIKLILPVLAMIALGFSTFLWRKCSLDIAPSAYLTYMHSWVTLFSIPLIIAFRALGMSNGGLIPDAHQLLFLTLAMAAGTAGDIFFGWSQKHSSFTLNSVIAPSSVVFSSLFGWLIAGQSLATIQVFGLTVVVGGLIAASTMSTPNRIETSFNQEIDEELADEMMKIKSEEISKSANRAAPAEGGGVAAA